MITHEAVVAILGPVCSPEEAARRIALAEEEFARMRGERRAREVQQGYLGCMTDAAELLAAEVRRLRAKILRIHADRVDSDVFAGGWRAASLLRHWANGIESGRIP